MEMIEKIKGRNENGPDVGVGVEKVLDILPKVALELDYTVKGNDCNDLRLR